MGGASARRLVSMQGSKWRPLLLHSLVQVNGIALVKKRLAIADILL